MSGSPVSSFSASLAAALVAPIEVPSGSRISKNSSVRLEVGKNCCCTRPKAAIAVTNMPTVTATTVLRQRRQSSITCRSAR